MYEAFPPSVRDIENWSIKGVPISTIAKCYGNIF